MKNLQNLKGAHQLSKKEQQSINGGGEPCIDNCSIWGGCSSNEICWSDSNGCTFCVSQGGNQ